MPANSQSIMQESSQSIMQNVNLLLSRPNDEWTHSILLCLLPQTWTYRHCD